MSLPFDLTPVTAGGARPVWNGRGFLVDGREIPVLEYSENFAGWSDDLTALHEDMAGNSHPIDLASRQNALAELGRHIAGKPNPVVLEIGCSSGFLLEDITRAYPDALLIGADVVKAPLVKLAEKLPSVPLLRFDLVKCPLPSGVFDAIILLNVLEHIEDDVAAMTQLHRLLKPGGIIIVEVPAGPHLYDAYDKALMHFRRYSMAELVAKARGAGLRPLSTSHLGFIVYPAFYLAKWLNRRREITPDKQEKLVEEQVSRTSGSRLMRWAFSLEGLLRRLVSLPWGIRCLLVARKGAKVA